VKLYLKYNPLETQEAIHGVDYIKGPSCGRKHQFMTRECHPVVMTQEDYDADSQKDLYIELVSFAHVAPLSLSGKLGEE